MKPILFNADMVRAIQKGTETVTRRVVRSRYCDSVFEMVGGELCEASPYKPPIDNGDGTTTRFVRHYVPCKPPYCPGDILYVQETFCINNFGCHYWADWPDDNCPDMSADDKWHPSIHMPRETARIFLRVTDVRVGRLQDTFFKNGSTIFALLKEGIDIGEQCRECIDAYGSPCCIDDESECGVLDDVRNEFANLWNRCYAAPRPIKGEDDTIDHYESYPWEDVNETRTYKGKPWYVIGNPWVWVIGFERISREEALP